MKRTSARDVETTVEPASSGPEGANMNEIRTRAVEPAGRGEQARTLDRIFDEVARVRVPDGADQLDLRLDVDAIDGVPAMHLALSLHAGGLHAGSGAALAMPPPEAVFGPRGHGTIAILAMTELEATRPDIKAKIDALLPADGSGRPNYFGAANWADYIRGARPDTKPWHFVDLVYEPADPNTAPDLPEPPHALSQLEVMSEQLQTSNDPAEQLEALRFVLHLVGDMHQPLHCITRVTTELDKPEGDRGGNLFKLSGHYRNLHSLWDDSVNIKLKDTAEVIAEDIAQQYPRESLAREIAIKDPEAWVRAGFALAIKRAYRPLEDAGDKPEPSEAYLRAALHTGQRQAALGGYRLADLLVRLLG